MRLRAAFESRRAPVIWLLAAAMLTGACSSNEAGPDDTTGVGTGSGGLGGGGGMVFDDCEPGDKPGSPTGADDELTPLGVAYNVRVPADYVAEKAHPLLVVFSPRVNDDSAAALEAFTGLGVDAPARGYVTVFVEWFDPTVAMAIEDVDSIRTAVAADWCVDESRVYYSGHSDGGSVTTVLTLAGQAPVAAVAPSAAGIEDVHGPSLGCAGATPAMVIHSADDEIFPTPGHGVGAASHWAGCWSCGALGPADANGCRNYEDCAGGEVIYCETSGSHYDWYGLNGPMLDFFDRHQLPP